jgi:L-aspartate oxidase
MAVFRSKFLILGSGVTGLSLGLKAAEYGTVNIVTKKKADDSNTRYAQGGIAAVLSKKDKFQYHIEDTLSAGAGLCHRDSVELIVSKGPDMIRELINLGAHFNLEKDGSFDLGREGGHSRRRIVHAEDMTGQEIENVLLLNIKKHSNAVVFQHHISADLVLDQNNRCWGAWVWDENDQEMHLFLAGVTVVCTGGCSRVYSHSTNPQIATGDGIAMAYRAGAMIANMEFIQFHPTAFATAADEMPFLISEAVRGEKAILRTADGTAFMENYHALKDLAPRDIVARAIDQEMKRTGEHHVYLDVSHLDQAFLRQRFPYITEYCKSKGLDLSQNWIPVVPAAHYTCGGIITDLWGQTNITGLYAAGESAFTGVHGANRLASNSLLEALVFSTQTLKKSVEDGLHQAPPPEQHPTWKMPKNKVHLEAVRLVNCQDALRRLMWDYIGIVRNDNRIQMGLKRFNVLREEIDHYFNQGHLNSRLLELRNLAHVAELIIHCAMHRKESRGLHYNTDHPHTSTVPENTHIWKTESGEIEISSKPIPNQPT